MNPATIQAIRSKLEAIRDSAEEQTDIGKKAVIRDAKALAAAAIDQLASATAAAPSPTLTPEKPQRRVVCAALRKRSMQILGARHFDPVMRGMIQYLNLPFDMADAKQGFIDQWGVFMDRAEAFEIATAAGQIRHKSGNPNSKELFSEDLY
jgi:hypothetical protein